MGDWVYTVRQREPKMEIPGKISLSARCPDEGNRATGPVAELTSQKLPDTSTHTLAEPERARIIATLRETNWVVGGRNGAAARLGLDRTTLIAKMRKLGILRETAEQSTGRSDTDAKAPLGRFSVPA
jgi:transcriptional regulator with GAF, ATPase, and Fis domain